jgi:hypothetical protein
MIASAGRRTHGACVPSACAGVREGGKWKLKRASSIVFLCTPTERFRAVRSNALRGFRNMKPFGASDECAVGRMVAWVVPAAHGGGARAMSARRPRQGEATDGVMW